MRTAVIDLLSAPVADDSVNRSLVPGGAGEAEIARVHREWAHGAGLGTQALE